MASIESDSKCERSRTAGPAVRTNVTNARAARSTIVYYEFPDSISIASEHFFSRFAQAEVHTRNLPHWAANSTLIFITYRLADSMPADKLRAWRAERGEWIRLHPEPWDEVATSEYYDKFPAKLDEMLDAGYGSCVLGCEDCRRIVVGNLLHFNGARYRLHSFVIMPNHVHVLMEIERREDLAKIVHGWKSYTAKKINAVVGGTGSVWQREYYDRLIRNAEHYLRTLEYIRKNAREAKGIVASNARAARCTSRTGCQPVHDEGVLARSIKENLK